MRIVHCSTSRVRPSFALQILSVAIFVTVSWQSRAQAAANPDGRVAGLKPKFADVNGINTRYYEMGQGEPMLLIHGGGWAGSSNANNFSTVIPGFAKHFHVYAPDRLGHGLTDNPKIDADYNQQGEANFIYQFISTMKMGQVHLVGHSSGGALAFYLAIEHPEVVKDLVLIAQGPQNPAAERPVLRVSKMPGRSTCMVANHFRRGILAGSSTDGEYPEIERGCSQTQGRSWRTSA
jgi:pimeloyl-ACP methyl ester carboxylesterase